MKNKRAVAALVATVLLILITVAGISIIWGAVMPMITKALQLGQTCMDARLSIDNLHGYTCYDESVDLASVMISRGSEDFNLAGLQIGLSSASGVRSYEIREGRKASLAMNLDEGSGNKTYDSSGSGYEGDINNASWVNGKIGKALSFDGASSSVDIAKGIIVANDISIEGWVKTISNPLTWENIFAGCNDPNNDCRSGDYDYISFSKMGNKLYFGITYYFSGGSSNYCQYFSTDDIPMDEWTHVAAVYDADDSDNNGKLYVNGKSVNRTMGCVGASRPAIRIFPSIGAMSWGYNMISGHQSYFNGQIDNVNVYLQTLTDDEIRKVYEAENIGKKLFLGKIPSINAETTYFLPAPEEEITEVTVAPILRVGNTEKICSVTSRVAMPGCIKLE